MERICQTCCSLLFIWIIEHQVAGRLIDRWQWIYVWEWNWRFGGERSGGKRKKGSKRVSVESNGACFTSIFPSLTTTCFPLEINLNQLREGEDWRSSVMDVCNWWSGLIMHLCMLLWERLREPFLLSPAVLSAQRKQWKIESNFSEQAQSCCSSSYSGSVADLKFWWQKIKQTCLQTLMVKVSLFTWTQTSQVGACVSAW